MTYYQERNGDYLVVYDENGGYVTPLTYRNLTTWDAKATALPGVAGSAQSTSVTEGYLRRCEQVKPSDIPEEWKRYLDK